MSILRISLTVFVSALLIATVSLRSAAAVYSSGSCSPSFSHSGDHTVTGALIVGYLSEGAVGVTEGSMLTTEEGTTLGYMTSAKGTVNVTDSTWMAHATTIVAHEFKTIGTVNLDNSTWTIPVYATIANGDYSVGTVNINNGSTWMAEEAHVVVADGEECHGEINVNNGTWTVANTDLGGTGFSGSDGAGIINIKADGVMNSLYELNVTNYGEVELDGGTLSLAGLTSLEGDFHATPNGGAILLNVGFVGMGHLGLVKAGNGVNFANCDIEIGWVEGLTPNTSRTFNVFGPLDGIDLATLLGNADSITTPAGWSLDHDTGVLSYSTVPEPACFVLLVLGGITMMRLRQRTTGRRRSPRRNCPS
jgi:hypothetical protein